MDFFRLALQLAKRPLPNLGTLRLGRLLAVLLPACAAAGVGLAALHAAGLAWAIAATMSTVAATALPALAEALRGQADARRRFRPAAGAAALAGWLAAVRGLLPIQSSACGLAAATHRRAIPPRPAAQAGRRALASLCLTPRLLPAPAASRAAN